MKFFEDIDYSALAVWLLLITVILTGNYAVVIAFGLALANKAFLTFLEYKQRSEDDKAHDLNMVMLQNQIDALKVESEQVKKIAEDAKVLLNKSNLALSFIPRSQRT